MTLVTVVNLIRYKKRALAGNSYSSRSADNDLNYYEVNGELPELITNRTLF